VPWLVCEVATASIVSPAEPRSALDAVALGPASTALVEGEFSEVSASVKL
jgi:hypothetical protein